MAVRLALKAMVEHKRKLGSEEAVAALNEMFSGNASPAATGAFLVALQQQELEPALLRACAEEMVNFAAPCTVPNPEDLMDIVGTGGDGHDTFNVSSAAGIIMAAAGVRCAKHGNRSASGSVGTADFLEALGCNLNLDGAQVAKAVEHCSFGFLFAPCFHPTMRHVGPVRKELGVKTIFNYLGPLTNPSRPSSQVIGVARPDLGPVPMWIYESTQFGHHRHTRQSASVHARAKNKSCPRARRLAWLEAVSDTGQFSPRSSGSRAHAAR